MLTIKKQLAVRLTGVQFKLDADGAKWATMRLTLTVIKGALQNGLLKAAQSMTDEASMDKVNCGEEMKSVRLEFASPATESSIQVFEVTNLFDFSLEREKTTQAGTLNSEASGRITVDFKFTVPLIQSYRWAGENYQDDLLMTIQKAQGEMFEEGQGAAESPDSPDSQPARNKRIEEGIAEDAVKPPKGKRAKKAKA